MLNLDTFFSSPDRCKKQILNSEATIVKSLICKKIQPNYFYWISDIHILFLKTSYFMNNGTEIQWIFGLNWFQTTDLTFD